MTKLLGIIGGVTYHSTIEYYRLINEGYARERGSGASAPMMVYNLDFSIVDRCLHSGNWNDLKQYVLKAALILKKSGCTGLLIASNTLHKFSPEILKTTGLELIHIGDAIGEEIQKRNLKRPLLLGTKLTMSESFLKSKIEGYLEDRLWVPAHDEKLEVHRIIFEELARGKILDASKKYYENLCQRYFELGADSVLLSCTEIGLLIPGDHGPYLDSLAIHAEAGVQHLLV